MKNSTQTYTKIFSDKRITRFFVLLIVFFFAGQILHFFSRPYTTPLLVHTLTASVCSKIINTITPTENTFSHEALISSGNHAIDISEGCEGIEGILLLTAAILAFYAGIKEKILGIIAGSVILYFSNLVRITVLFYIFKYNPALFDVMHIFVGQTFIIFVGIIFFILWINTCAETYDTSQ